MRPNSPLRYPGGKTKFAGLIQRAMLACLEPPRTFVEPFCGGAGVGLTLLDAGNIDTLALNDLDPLVATFWQVVFGRTGRSPRACRDDVRWLVDQILSVQVTVAEWQAQKAAQPGSPRALAFKCLFLNRTSFNGIVHKAGPIGGWGQGNRKLDVRFNREWLVRRIEELWGRRDQVSHVRCEPWRKFVGRFRRPGHFLYLDPPYYHRAEQLYGYLFDQREHELLRNWLVRTVGTPWVLSYDDSAEVRALYSGYSQIDGLVVDKTYSAHPLGGGRFVGRELFFSNRDLQIDARRHKVDHSAVSVVGRVAAVAPPLAGPARLPIRGDRAQRRRELIAA